MPNVNSFDFIYLTLSSETFAAGAGLGAKFRHESLEPSPGSINKINFTCARLGFGLGGAVGMLSYYFDYVYFSHEILMPVTCALLVHLINSQTKREIIFTEFSPHNYCSFALPNFSVISQVKKHEIRQNYLELH